MFWNSLNSCIVFDAVKLKTCDEYSKIIQIIKQQNEKNWKFYVTLAKKYKKKQQH